MASGDQVMRILGDFANYIAGARKAEEATGKVAKKAATIGDQFGNALLKVDLLKQGLLKAYRLMEAINERNVSASRSSDDRAIALGVAAGAVGADPYRAQKIIENRKGAGSASADADVSFLESVAGMNESRPVGLNPDEVIAALELYHRIGELGAGKGGSGIVKGLARGESLEQISKTLAQTRGNTFQEAGSAMGRLNAEAQTKIDVEGKRSAAGAEMRAFSEASERRSAESNLHSALSYFMPNIVLKSLADDKSVPNAMQEFWGGGKAGYAGGVDKTAEAIGLGNEIRNLGNVINKSQTIPNGNTGVP